MNEMYALRQNQTWELTLFPDGKRTMSCSYYVSSKWFSWESQGTISGKRVYPNIYVDFM